jgi:hypothetical protein
VERRSRFLTSHRRWKSLTLDPEMFAAQPESFGGDQRQWSFGRVQVNVDVGQIDPASLADGGQCLPAMDMRRRWSEHSLHQLMIDQVALMSGQLLTLSWCLWKRPRTPPVPDPPDIRN